MTQAPLTLQGDRITNFEGQIDPVKQVYTLAVMISNKEIETPRFRKADAKPYTKTCSSPKSTSSRFIVRIVKPRVDRPTS